MEGFEVLLLIGRLFFIMNIAQISTSILKLKMEFSKKAEMESKDSPFSMTIITNLHRHYKHNNKEVRVFRIVKIG